MQKQQRLIGMLIVITLAVGLGIINERRGDVENTPGSGSSQRSPAVRATARPRDDVQRAATPQPRDSTARATPTPTGRSASAAQQDALPPIAFAALPREAQHTIRLIQAGGPFPFEKDGSIFRNRERLLPRRPDGYYREYTVITPGEDDRGARRIVAGGNGELYYTDDHYESFSRVE